TPDQPSKRALTALANCRICARSTTPANRTTALVEQDDRRLPRAEELRRPPGRGCRGKDCRIRGRPTIRLWFEPMRSSPAGRNCYAYRSDLHVGRMADASSRRTHGAMHRDNDRLD